MKHGKENFGAPQCLHFKFNDEQCRQPALRHKKYCRFHKFIHEANSAPSNGRLLIPLAEDTPSIQIGINQIMRGIVAGDIDHKTAWLLLYSLQLSTSNIAKQRDVFPPPEPEEEEKEEPPSLAKLLLEKLRENPYAADNKEENERPLHTPRNEPPGYPEIPPPIDMLQKKEQPKANT